MSNACKLVINYFFSKLLTFIDLINQSISMENYKFMSNDMFKIYNENKLWARSNNLN